MQRIVADAFVRFAPKVAKAIAVLTALLVALHVTGVGAYLLWMAKPFGEFGWLVFSLLVTVLGALWVAIVAVAGFLSMWGNYVVAICVAVHLLVRMSGKDGELTKLVAQVTINNAFAHAAFVVVDRVGALVVNVAVGLVRFAFGVLRGDISLAARAQSLLVFVVQMPARWRLFWAMHNQKQQQPPPNQPRDEGLSLVAAIGILGLQDLAQGGGLGAHEFECRRRYRELSKKHHPDAGGSDAKQKELNAAWDVVCKQYGWGHYAKDKAKHA